MIRKTSTVISTDNGAGSIHVNEITNARRLPGL